MAELFGGFAEDVRTPEDMREVLQSLAGADPEAWDILLQNPKLTGEARNIALEERKRLR